MHYKKFDGMMCRPAVVLKGDEELTEDPTLVTCKVCLKKLSKPAPVPSVKKGRAQIPGEGWKKDIPREVPVHPGCGHYKNPKPSCFKGQFGRGTSSPSA